MMDENKSFLKDFFSFMTSQVKQVSASPPTIVVKHEGIYALGN